jgi:CheY-like chemotaxis protein/AraC-like DNA-binding protein
MSGARRLILAVDDDPSIHEAFGLIFEDQYEFLGVTDGAAAIDVLRSRHVDLVLLDILMPRLGGLKVLELARQIRPQTPIVVVSVIDRAAEALEAIRLGAADYVTKPFEPDALARLVSRTIAASAAPESEGRDRIGSRPPRLLLVGGDVGLRASLTAVFQDRCHVGVGKTPAVALQQVGRARPDLVIAEPPTGPDEPETTLRILRADIPPAPLIFIDPRREPVPGGTRGLPKVNAVLHRPLDFTALFREIIRLVPPRPRMLALQPFSPLTTRVVAYLADHYPEATVERLADAVGVSSGYLARSFRHEMTITPHDHITRVRIEAAKCLLRETDEKVEVVAATVGLCGAPHLARLFRQHVGVSPRAFRAL